MDEYAYEIHVPDVNAPGGWLVKDDTKTVTAYDESEAARKAEQFAHDNYSRWRVRNVRLLKRYTNPDGEI